MRLILCDTPISAKTSTQKLFHRGKQKTPDHDSRAEIAQPAEFKNLVTLQLHQFFNRKRRTVSRKNGDLREVNRLLMQYLLLVKSNGNDDVPFFHGTEAISRSAADVMLQSGC